MKMAGSFFNFQIHNPIRGRRVRALRLYDIIPIFVIVLFLYLWMFSTIVRMVINGRTFPPDNLDQYLNDTHFDLSFLKSLPAKTKQSLSKSNLKLNNRVTHIPQSLNQTQLHLVSLSSSTPPPPTPLTQHQIQEQQLSNIVAALIGAGDFAGWANLLSSSDLSSLPLTATFFIPGNNAMSNLEIQNLDPFLIAYHIIPQRLLFSDLQQFKPNTRIPTLLPSKFIVVTNNSVSNFTIDGSHITYPDVYVNSDFTVHGVDKVLEYSVYGADPLFTSPPMNYTVPNGDADTDVVAASPPLKQPKSVLPSFYPAGRGFIDGWKSSDSTVPLAIEKFMMIIVVCLVVSIFLV
ncbi:uncharacterized protein LOC132599576 [Lycium barbarum]|uniref:uncharacterized protein LOC132599576 n=1 Tax=Lycium barbarum TaxID=112863 RepID=UPI00293E359F|nr:uncharacterized protein LOC132599576 [Lycium barbarum]